MRRWLTGAAAVIAGMLAITFGVLSGPLPAQATDAHAFDPAEIISDANFYDANAMTAADVQNFLNQHVPTCHPEWDGSLASTIVCLKDYHQQTTAKSADAYCSGYSSQWQSAAQIIDGVARSCGISQKVILVTLQKESALVNHPDPSPWRYTTAMGYGCPDYAPCDAQYNGLFNQIYNAARQFKLYQAKPSSYQYRAGQNNYIQWNPNAGCGGSTVYIRNQATAGLYDYTPYQPNAAALNAGYGEGDSCSTYGNRNFFLWYSDWFGTPVDPPVSGEINTAWQRAGASSGILGKPVDAQHCTGSGQAAHCYQDFANGTIDWSPATGAHFTTGPIRAAWSRVGWGTLGLPTGDQWCDANGARCFQIFVNGAIDWTPATGAHPTWGAIRSFWTREGANTSADGLPISDPTWWPQNGGGWAQDFQHGSLHATGSTVFRVPTGPIRAEYIRQGFQAGVLGWPTSQQTCTLPGGGCRQNFQRGIIVSTGTTAARLDGDIQTLWEQLGGANGTPGYPLGNTTWWPQNGGGYVQQFQHGSIHWTPTTGAIFVPQGPIQAEYIRQGFQAGVLGWPTSQQTCTLPGGGCRQNFQRGIIVSTGTTAARLDGDIQTLWEQLGGANGTPGYPLGNTTWWPQNGGGYVQQFQHGSIHWTPWTRAVFVPSGPIQAEYIRQGFQAGRLGWPTGPQTCDAHGVCTQRFAGGILVASPGTGVAIRPL